MASLDVDTSQLEAIQRLLRSLAGGIQNIERANRQLSVELYQFVIRNIDSGGRLVGGWAPITEATRREKRRIGKEKVMIRSGTLRQSFTPFHNANGAGVTTDLEYAKFQNDGTATIPARRLLPSPEQQLEIAKNVYGGFLNREIGMRFPDFSAFRVSSNLSIGAADASSNSPRAAGGGGGGGAGGGKKKRKKKKSTRRRR